MWPHETQAEDQRKPDTLGTGRIRQKKGQSTFKVPRHSDFTKRGLLEVNHLELSSLYQNVNSLTFVSHSVILGFLL